jgi:hypothetical protein
MSTIVEQAAADFLNRHPEWAELAIHVRQKLKAGRYPQDYVDAICQCELTLEEVVGFIKVHHLIASGCVWTCMVRAGGQPHGDSAIEENNELLRDLPEPFEAVFEPEVGGSAHSDGLFTIKEPVQMDKNLSMEVRATKLIEPCFMPLEVGQTTATRTWLHLAEDTRLARWAYRSDWIWVFVLDREEADRQIGLHRGLSRILEGRIRIEE